MHIPCFHSPLRGTGLVEAWHDDECPVGRSIAPADRQRGKGPGDRCRYCALLDEPITNPQWLRQLVAEAIRAPRITHLFSRTLSLRAMRTACFLLIDDNAATRFLQQRLLERLLERLDVATEVGVAASGTLALAGLPPPATGAWPELILLDWQMPGLGGLGFLEHYQRLLPLPHLVSVFVLTAHTNLLPEDLEALQRLPVAGIFTKPLTPQMVEHMLQAHTQRVDAASHSASEVTKT